MSLAARVGRFRTMVRSLIAAGVTPRSALTLPIRRRLPLPGGTQIRLRDGTTFAAAPGESLLPALLQISEIWGQRAYLPTDWPGNADATVVDVGANIGVFSVWAVRELGAARVIAVEPGPAAVGALRGNIGRNRLDRVELIPVALGRDPRTATLFSRGPSSMNTLFQRDLYGSDFEEEAQVEVITLDDLFERFGIDRCDLLKLDCEGAEYESPAGAGDETLGRVSRIVGEYHEGLAQGGPESLRRQLEVHGFVVKVFAPLDEEGGHFHAWRSV
jgi:FkbM family methyltransferase